MSLPPAPDVSRAVSRRELGRFLGGLVAAAALPDCAGSSGAPRAGAGATGSAHAARTVQSAGVGGVELYSWFDLPTGDPRARELSGIAWDDATRTLWGVQDESANVVRIVPDRAFETWKLGATIELKLGFPLDLEGIVVVDDGFIVASEKGPRVLHVDREGHLVRDILLPDHFAQARDNKSLESLTRSPSGHFLFTTSEAALSCDGDVSTASDGSMLRILRIARDDLPANAKNAPAHDGGVYEEHAYVTDAVPHPSGDFGVADLAAISDDELLVLERGWTRGSGNTARIYRVALTDSRASCLGSPSLARGAPSIAKQLVIDLLHLPTRGMPPPKQRQASALLDNYEGMTLGPVLPDGRPSILLVSDDNNRSDQTSRILVLAVGAAS